MLNAWIFGDLEPYYSFFSALLFCLPSSLSGALSSRVENSSQGYSQTLKVFRELLFVCVHTSESRFTLPLIREKVTQIPPSLWLHIYIFLKSITKTPKNPD